MDRMYSLKDLEAAGLYGPAYCTCLEDDSPYITATGYCAFCEAVEKVDARDKALQTFVAENGF